MLRSPTPDHKRNIPHLTLHTHSPSQLQSIEDLDLKTSELHQ